MLITWEEMLILASPPYCLTYLVVITTTHTSCYLCSYFITWSAISTSIRPSSEYCIYSYRNPGTVSSSNLSEIVSDVSGSITSEVGGTVSSVLSFPQPDKHPTTNATNNATNAFFLIENTS